jgi:predicted MFS family arabinose efflux permease
VNPAHKDRIFLYFIGISLIYTACFFQLFTNLTAYFKTVLHFSERYIGFLLSWNGILIVLIEMAVVFWIENNWSKRKAITIGVFIHVVAYCLLLLIPVNKQVAFLIMTLITMSEIFAFSMLTSFWMLRANDRNRGQYAGMWTMTWAIAQSSGPFAGSLVAQYAGFRYLWMVIALLSGLAAFLYARLIKN